MPRKYISKTLNGSQYWWNQLTGDERKKFDREESRAALIYEAAARIDLTLSRSPLKKVEYPIKNRNWRQLSKLARHRITTWLLPRLLSAILVYDYESPENSKERSYVSRQNWSPQFRIRFDLNYNTQTILNELAEHLVQIRKKHAKFKEPPRPLEGRANKPPSFRPVELLDKRLRGERLTSKEKHYLREFVERNHDDLLNARGLLPTLRLKRGMSPRVKGLTKPDLRLFLEHQREP